MTEAEQIMKRCQAGTRNYEEANNLHAACYGIIGRLLAQEPPKYSFKAHWEKDGRIGIAGAVVRPDGGVHVLQDTIDPPEQEPTMWERRPDGKIGPTNALQRTWQGLTNDEIKEYLLKPVERDLLSFTRFIEAKLKQKNGYAEDKNT